MKISFTYLNIAIFLSVSCGPKDNADETFQPPINPPQTYKLNQNHGGGFIFYLDPTKQHGLIAAPSDIIDVKGPYYLTVWCADEYAYKKVGTQTAIGSGLKNTEAIVKLCTVGASAAKICYDYELGGFTDWYLPSYLELFELKKFQDGHNFSSSGYITSSEDYQDLDWVFSIPFGMMRGDHATFKTVGGRVRAIRSF